MRTFGKIIAGLETLFFFTFIIGGGMTIMYGIAKLIQFIF